LSSADSFPGWELFTQAGSDCPSRIFEDILAVHTLAHEVWHLHGISNEASTECNALQTTAGAAELFGADSQSAQATAVYALHRFYPNLPDEIPPTGLRERRAARSSAGRPGLALVSSRR